MPHVIDLGAGPTNEDCAQLGQSPDFDALNRLEIATYKCALIARYGAPPPGCRLAALSNAHDFGRYVTLVLHIDDETDEAVCAYAEQVEEGLGTWLEAGFSAPVIHDGEPPRIVHPDSTAAVVSALLITRPRPDGRFPVPDFETLHTNLAGAFPDEAAAARARLSDVESA